LWHADQLPASGLLLGFDAAQPEPTPVVADWPGLASTLIGGQSQSGKSTLVRGLLLQSALQGGRFVVCDPHAGAGEKSLAYSLRPLHRLMLCEPAATDSQISDALAFVESIALGRLHGDSDRTPVVLVIDELTALLNRSGIAARLTQVLQMLATETNKVNIFAVCIGQLFHSRQFDTTARNAFVSFISTRNRQENAKAQSGNTEFARLAAGLVVGEAVWQSAAGEILRLAVPNATQRHVELVARQLESGVFAVDGPENRAPALLPPVEPGPPSGPGPGPQSETIRAAGDDGDADVDRAGPDDNSDVALTVDPVRAALVRRLFTEGKNRGEIIRAVWDIEAKQGTRAFKTAARELDEILRALVRGKL
jgi:hypothetical protein